MPAIISLLRGVNVGGYHKIKMDALREIYESLGLKHVKTYVQSGNIVFTTEAREWAQFATRIESAIESAAGFRPGVMLRTAAEMREIIARNPFADRAGIEAAKLAVIFLGGEPSAESRERIAALNKGGYPEEVYSQGRELYMYFPNGMGRPKLPVAQVERAVKIPGTARNWNTVTKLLAIAEEIER
jgi:uncharacterized protein (DUF1697 family)